MFPHYQNSLKLCYISVKVSLKPESLTCVIKLPLCLLSAAAIKVIRLLMTNYTVEAAAPLCARTVT